MTNVSTILSGILKKECGTKNGVISKEVFFRLENLLWTAWHNIHYVVKLDFSKSIKIWKADTK